MTVRDQFEGRELPATYNEQDMRAFLARERFKSTRAPFQRVYFKGVIAVPAGQARTFQIASSTSRDIERLKRIQFKLMVPKGNDYGWMGFLRDPEGVSVDNAISFDAPMTLRPSVWLANPDFATYWDAYLPAVNLADGGTLLGMVANDGSLTLTAAFVGRLVLERGIEG